MSQQAAGLEEEPRQGGGLSRNPMTNVASVNQSRTIEDQRKGKKGRKAGAKAGGGNWFVH